MALMGLPLLLACGGTLPTELESTGKLEFGPESVFYSCYEGFRPEPRTALFGAWHIYTYCVNENDEAEHQVFQDGWADPTDSRHYRKGEDIFLGTRTLAQLLDAEEFADSVMRDRCFGVELLPNDLLPETFGETLWNERCQDHAGEEDEDPYCHDFAYPEWPISYSIPEGCYCFAWQEQFRMHIGLPLESIYDSIASAWLPEGEQPDEDIDQG